MFGPRVIAIEEGITPSLSVHFLLLVHYVC